MKFNLVDTTRYLFRLAIAGLFVFFGVLAILEPETQAAQWIKKEYADIIISFLPINIFMVIFGVIEIFVGISLVFGVLYRLGLVVAAMLLVGIIVNLGFNELSLRDFVILTGVLYLLAQDFSSRYRRY